MTVVELENSRGIYVSLNIVTVIIISVLSVSKLSVFWKKSYIMFQITLSSSEAIWLIDQGHHKLCSFYQNIMLTFPSITFQLQTCGLHPKAKRYYPSPCYRNETCVFLISQCSPTIFGLLFLKDLCNTHHTVHDWL